MYLIGVPKAFSNNNNRVKVRYKPKTQHRAYFIDENGKIITEKLSKSKYFIFKYLKTKYKRRKFNCPKCKNRFSGLVKSSKDKLECPNC